MWVLGIVGYSGEMNHCLQLSTIPEDEISSDGSVSLAYRAPVGKLTGPTLLISSTGIVKSC